MEYIFALKTTELPIGTMKIIKLNNTDVLISNIDNKFYAINNVCTHLRGSLGNGKLEGNIVTCPNHGAKFDVTTGQCEGPAKIAFLKITPKNESVFPVKIEQENILIGIE